MAEEGEVHRQLVGGEVLGPEGHEEHGQMETSEVHVLVEAMHKQITTQVSIFIDALGEKNSTRVTNEASG